MLAMTYGSIYVAKIALGASPVQAVKAFVEAENYNGPSLIVAYSHCIAHGYNLIQGYEHQKQAVASGYWPLYRYNPDLKAAGQNPPAGAAHLSGRCGAGRRQQPHRGGGRPRVRGPGLAGASLPEPSPSWRTFPARHQPRP